MAPKQKQAPAPTTRTSEIVAALNAGRTPQELKKEFTKQQLQNAAQDLGVELGSDTTAIGIAEALYAGKPEPEQPTPVAEQPAPKGKAIKRRSDIEDPVEYVWLRCDQLAAAAIAEGKPLPRRKDVTEQLIVEGVAYHTARTQYQLWHKHTSGGKRLVADGNPRIVKRAKAQN